MGNAGYQGYVGGRQEGVETLASPAQGEEGEQIMMTGICLPGGGAAGANQAGMLLALQSLRHHISKVSSASVGGLNGALFVMNRMRRLEEIWRGITPKQVFRKYPFLLFPGGRRLVSAGPLEKLLRDELCGSSLANKQVELFASAVEYWTGDTVTASSHTTPHFWQWLMASASLPVVFGPFKINGKWYVDGGVSDNTPLKPLIKAGCDRIIVLHCHPEHATLGNTRKAPSRLEQATGLLGLFMRATQRQDTEGLREVNRMIESGIAVPGKRHIELIEISPSPETEVGTLEFDAGKTRAAIVGSRRIAEQQLADLSWEKTYV